MLWRLFPTNNAKKIRYSQRETARPIPYSCICERFILIFPWSVHLFSCSRIGRPLVEKISRSQKHECRKRDWGRAASFLGIFVSNFRYTVFAMNEWFYPVIYIYIYIWTTAPILSFNPILHRWARMWGISRWGTRWAWAVSPTAVWPVLNATR